MHLAICHSLIITQNIYSADSPDELALVEGARELGFVFSQRDANNIITVRFPNEKKTRQY
jgi:magnesium-transporting ATPase (P-type)